MRGEDLGRACFLPAVTAMPLSQNGITEGGFLPSPILPPVFLLSSRSMEQHVLGAAPSSPRAWLLGSALTGLPTLSLWKPVDTSEEMHLWEPCAALALTPTDQGCIPAPPWRRLPSLDSGWLVALQPPLSHGQTSCLFLIVTVGTMLFSTWET